MFVTVEKAVQVVDRISELLGMTPPGISLDCPDCFEGEPKVIACFEPKPGTKTGMICFRSRYIPDSAPAHEMGHAYLYWVTGRHNCNAMDCEALPEFFELVWELNKFQFGRCQVCGSSSPWSIDRLGGVLCQECHSVYDIGFSF